MPAKTTTNAILAKMGTAPKASLQAHAKDETRYGVIRLPGGISDGVARIENIYIAQHEDGENKGKLYFRAVGVVEEPGDVMVAGRAVRVRGLQTSVVVGLYAQGKRTEEQADADLLNHLRMLAGPRATDNVRCYADCGPIIDAIKNARPYFRFSTRESAETRNPDGTVKYEARVWEDWHGTKGLEGYRPQPSANGQQKPVDNSGVVPPAVADRAKANPPVSPPQGPTDTTTDAEYRDDMDLASLGKRADPPDSDQDAIDLLEKYAKDAGIADDVVKAAPSWSAVVDLIKGGQKALTSDQAAAVGDDATWEPKVGENYGYFPPNKDGTPSKKKVICEVMTVDTATETVELRRIDNKKVRYKNVAFTDLKDTE